MINLFSFFVRKKENTLPTKLEGLIETEEYQKLQDTLIVFFEKKQQFKIEKIRNGIIYFQKPIQDTNEDRLSIVSLLDITAEEDMEMSTIWEDVLFGFDLKKIKKWENAQKYISKTVFSTEEIQKTAIIATWISEKEKEVFILKLPNRNIQLAKTWLDVWQKSTNDLNLVFEKKQQTFLNPKPKNTEEKIGTHTKRPQRKTIGDNTDFDLSLKIDHNLKDRKLMAMINDQAPLLNNEENYEQKIRFSGGESYQNTAKK